MKRNKRIVSLQRVIRNLIKKVTHVEQKVIRGINAKQKVIKKTFLAFIISVWVLLLLYLMNIINFSVGGEVEVLKYVHLIESVLFHKKTVIPEDVLFVNTSYDKALVPVYDEFGLPKGNIDITDRSKILEFLRAADKNRKYKYIILDIFFEKKYQTEYDSLLFEQIVRMPRIIIPKHRDGILAHDMLLQKAAYSDYRTDVEESGFIKYPLFIKNEPTLASAMYEEYFGKKFEYHRFYAIEDGKMIQQSLFPSLLLSNIPDYDKDKNKIIFNLSEDLLSLNEYGMLDTLLSNKYIIIGSFYEQDIHATFKGSIPGCLIHFNVFRSLIEGKHHINVGLVLFLLILFWIMSFNCISGKNLFNPKNKIVSVLLSWLSYSIVLAVLCIISYICFHIVFDIFITATVFEFIKQIIKLMKKHEKVSNME